MTKPWITVVTTPRRPEYLEATVSAIDSTGGKEFDGERRLFTDGDGDQLEWRPPADWQVFSRGRTYRGNSFNAIRVCRDAAIAGTPYILFFEDDIALTRNAITVMSQVEIPPDCWALQFCDLRSFGDRGTDKIRIFRQSIANYTNEECDPTKACTMWGNQSLKIPLRTLKLIDKSTLIDRWEQNQGPHHADVLLSLISLEQTDAPYLGIVGPSLAQHVGMKSLCNLGRNLTDLGRSSRTFPGVDFDALKLRT